MKGSALDKIGQWPIPGPEARERKEILVLRPGETLDVIHGSKQHVLVSFAVSNDYIHFGSITIPGGVLSDPEVHPNGDEVFYALDGDVSVVIPAGDETESVTKSRFEVRQGERFLLPEGTTHSYLNTSSQPVTIVFGVAPSL